VKLNKWLISGIVLLVAVGVRFYGFRENIYFGFDEARDAYTSTQMYLTRDFKLLGPPAGSGIGIFHSPLHWYLVGPIYLLGDFDPAFVAATFKLINALVAPALFLVLLNLFPTAVAFLSSLLFAFSYEQYLYSGYVGNPSWAIWAFLLILYGTSLLVGKSKRKNLGVYLMLAGAGIASCFNLMYLYAFFLVAIIVFYFRKDIKIFNIKFLVTSAIVAFVSISPYFLAELKSGFARVLTFVNLSKQGFGQTETLTERLAILIEKFLLMFHDNVFGYLNNNLLIASLAFALIVWVYRFHKSNATSLLVIWIFGAFILIPFGVHRGYYNNIGLGLGVIVLFAMFLMDTAKKSKFMFAVILLITIVGNLILIKGQSGKSLPVSFKPQPMMRLVDEIAVMDEMYTQANGDGFTIRHTGIPYKVQTLWAYLFNYVSIKKYGYLPFWENGNTLGFPGELPIPKNGTTCLRFRVREPDRGLPQNLIDEDIVTENYFSTVTKESLVGDFVVETRQAKDPKCHRERP